MIDGVCEVEGSDEDLGNARFDVMDEMVELSIERGLGEKTAGDERGGVEGANGLMDEIHRELTKIGEELSVSGQINSEITNSQKQRRIFNISVEHLFPFFRNVGAGADLQRLDSSIERKVRLLTW